MRIGFFAGSLQFRGVHVAIFDYAFHNQILLGNESVIFYDGSDPGAQEVLDKFRKHFEVIPYSVFSDLNHLTEAAKIDALYLIKAGNKDEKMIKSCPNLVHAVFPQKISEQHGFVYAFISKWLSQACSRSKIPYVEHMIRMPETDLNLRSELSIPETATVFGFHGGHDSFNIDFVKKVVWDLVESYKNFYFIFMNIDKFADHPQIKFLPGTSDMLRKVKFINTSDAMIHAREIGESFGIACGEYSIRNKPIFTYAHSSHRNHIEILGSKAFLYSNEADLKELLTKFDPQWAQTQNWDCYSEKFSPSIIIEQFRETFLRPVQLGQSSLVKFSPTDRLILGSRRLQNKFIRAKS